MSERWRRLLGGHTEGRRRRWLTFVGGYAVVVAAGTAYRLRWPSVSGAPVLYEDSLITALLLGPVVVAAVGVAVGGGLALSLAVGATSALAYGVVLAGGVLVSTGELGGAEELLTYVLASAVVGLVSGLVGWLAGSAIRLRRRSVRDGA